MLIDSMNLIKATIFKNSAHDTFKQVAKNLWSLKWLELALIHWKVLMREGVVQVISNIFL